VFRFESGNHSDLERLFEFTMHELVYVGPEDKANHHAATLKRLMELLLDNLDLSGGLVAANDMFIGISGATDQARMFAQLSTQAKIEMMAVHGLEHTDRMAVASLNYHGTHFTKPLAISEKKDDHSHPAMSLCFGIGIERLAYALASQHGQAAVDLLERLNPKAIAKQAGLSVEI
jgi:hypothetical protein